MNLKDVRQMADSECTSWAEARAALKFMLAREDESVLQREEGDPDSDIDFELRPDRGSVWITVGNVSIMICQSDRHVEVLLYPVGYELEGEIDCATVDFSDANNLIAEYAEKRSAA